MNKREQEPMWYNRLRNGPFPHSRLTPALMERIHRQAERLEWERKQRRKSMRRMKLALAAIVLLLGGSLGLASLGGETKLPFFPRQPAGIVDPAPMPQPPVISKPEQENSRHWLQITAQSGLLSNALPFLPEEVQSAALVRSGKAEQTWPIPAERLNIITEMLAWTDLGPARAGDSNEVDDSMLLLRLDVGGQAYDIPYRLADNTLQLGSGSYYANERLPLLVNGLTAPDSTLGELDRMLEVARADQERNLKVNTWIDESFSYDRDRLQVSGRNFNDWESALESMDREGSLYFFDTVTGTVKPMGVYGGDNRIVSLNLMLVFEGGYETPDGVHVGLTKDEIVQKLGKPNLELDSKWGYKSGDSLRFYLYFEEGKVKYMTVTQSS